MAWTTKQKSDLDNSMVAAQNVSLGTTLGGFVDNAIKVGSYTAVGADDTANYAQIASGLTAIAGWIVQVYRAGVDVTNAAVVSVQSTTNLRIADGGTYAVTAGDIVKYIIW